MAVSTKRKRKLLFDNELYLWYVKEDYDSLDYNLHIVSADCKVCLIYRINQINDEFIHPKISVLQSDRLKPGVYSFFPPLADETISSANVRAILNWHKNT